MLVPVLALAMLQSEVPPSLRGESLYHDCVATIRLFDGDDKSADTVVSANLCLNYIGGYRDGLTLGQFECVPLSVSNGTLVRLYVNYMRDHPKMMDLDRGFGLGIAIGQSYPCKPGPRKK